MDEPIQSTTQDQNMPQEPSSQGTPWLKYAGIFLGVLIIINLGLFAFYFFSKQKSALKNELVGTLDEQGFLLTKTGQNISREGYSIAFSNPRYEHFETESHFKVDVVLENQAFEPSIKVIANCDIEEGGIIIKEGAGATVESGGSGEILPGNSSSWTALIILGNKEQKVSSCLYAPAGVFDPNQTVKVVF